MINSHTVQKQAEVEANFVGDAYLHRLTKPAVNLPVCTLDRNSSYLLFKNRIRRIKIKILPLCFVVLHNFEFLVVAQRKRLRLCSPCESQDLLTQ